MSETIPGGSGAKGAAGDLGVYPFVTAPQVDDLARTHLICHCERSVAISLP